jgi:hypothetical protein
MSDEQRTIESKLSELRRWRDERSNPPAPEVWIWRDGHHYPCVSFNKPPPHITAVRYVRPPE